MTNPLEEKIQALVAKHVASANGRGIGGESMDQFEVNKSAGFATLEIIDLIVEHVSGERVYTEKPR